jgi:hypothetical protein
MFCCLVQALVQKMSVSLPKVDAAPSDARLLQAVKVSSLVSAELVNTAGQL